MKITVIGKEEICLSWLIKVYLMKFQPKLQWIFLAPDKIFLKFHIQELKCSQINWEIYSTNSLENLGIVKMSCLPLLIHVYILWICQRWRPEEAQTQFSGSPRRTAVWAALGVVSHRCATGEAWQDIMLACMPGKKCAIQIQH